jgi:hypothetical protein
MNSLFDSLGTNLLCNPFEKEWLAQVLPESVLEKNAAFVSDFENHKHCVPVESQLALHETSAFFAVR